MNDSTANKQTAIPGLVIPRGSRAVLVSEGDQPGMFDVTPVERDKSVLNIERDLLKHLNEEPCSTEWLAMLRDYCDQRIAARGEARALGAFITPNPRFDWEMRVSAQ